MKTFSQTMSKYYAEFFGTFMLVFAGAGAITINDLYGGSVTHPGIALVFGLVVLAIIYAIGNVSGAHVNPAVSIALAVAGRFKVSQVVPYVISQLLGAVAASALLWTLFLGVEGSTHFGATLPAGADWQSFVFELVLTWFLMLVILGVTSGSEIKGELAGIAIGATVGFEAMFAGPVCGASMNPARSLGPALFDGNLSVLWIYLLAPVAGAILAVGTFCLLHPAASDSIVSSPTATDQAASDNSSS